MIDASGTWATPSPLGADGLPADGEQSAADGLSYRVPDLNSPPVQARYAGRRTAVVGSGASAFTALAQLADLAGTEPGTHAVWVLCRGIGADTYGGARPTSSPPAAPSACAPGPRWRPGTRAP